MTDRPIIFSAPMIKALLAGRKSMTRRLYKPTAPFDPSDDIDVQIAVGSFEPYPYVVGDRLWCREAWRTKTSVSDELKPAHLTGMHPVLYDADADWSLNKTTGRSRSPIHLPRWASRITLTVTAVRVERLNSITPADAIAEGIAPAANSQTIDCDTPNPVDGFRSLWNSLHDPDAWAANPWVVAVSFTVETRNIDARTDT